MNKKYIKLLIIPITLFLFINNINASTSNNICDVHIGMTSKGSYTGWKTNALICDGSTSHFTGKFRSVFSTSNAYSGAIIAADSADDKLTAFVSDASNKFYTQVEYYRCMAPERYVEVTSKCSYKVLEPRDYTRYGYVSCSSYSYSNCPSDCYKDLSTHSCKGGNHTYVVAANQCRSGAVPYSANYCTREKSYSITSKADSSTMANIKQVAEQCIVAARSDGEMTAGSCTCTATWSLMCPIYMCIPERRTIDACSPSFQVDNSKAYCVNPNQGFNPTGGNNYMIDDQFDVRNCRTSYATTDCGYANIMIEGNYYSQKDKDTTTWNQAMELAMRLWGKHSGQAGFGNDKIGLSLLSGTGCSTSIQYASIENIYSKTHDHIWSQYFETLTNMMRSGKFKDSNGIDYLNASKAESDPLNNLFNVTCQAVDLNTVCGNTRAMKRGFALFFNTVFGNNYMQEHLNELFGFEVNTRPTDVDVETNDEDSRVVLTFDKTVSNTEKEQYDCSKIDSDKSLTEDQKTYIKQYCTVEVKKLYIVDSNGNEVEVLDVDNNDKIYDASKGTLLVKTEKFAVCDKITEKRYKNYKVVLDYKKTKSGYSVRKYVACTNPKANQMLFAFYQDKDIKNDVQTGQNIENGTEETYNVSFNCSNTCTDYGTKMKTPVCQDKENSVYSGYLRDPSLKCIINMVSDINKGYYDYSNYFHVNTNLCRVYCSDEIQYHLADKVTVNSGLSFKYDIKPAGLTLNEADKKISSVIEEKRTCVSEIYYNKEFPTTPDWKGLYGITQSDIDSVLGKNALIRNWNELFTVLFARKGDELTGSGSKLENLNQLIYDLYNCNFIPEEQMPKEIWRPTNNEMGNLYKYVQELYGEENGYGLNIYNWTDNITYQGGAEYKNKNGYVGSSSEDISTDKNIKGSINKNIKYCTDKNNVECMAYKTYNAGDTKTEEENYTYDKFTTKSNYEPLRIDVTGNNTLSRFKNVKIPTNDYALFGVTTQVDFYNTSEFQVEAYTGKVLNKKDNTYNNEVIDLEKYIYPMSKEAYNRCTINGNISKCKVTQSFSNVTTFYRNRLSDDFSKKVKNEFKEFTCNVDVKVPQISLNNDNGQGSGRGEETIYRNVDLSNLFPTESSNNTITNWKTDYGLKAQKDIESSGDYINTDRYLEYKIELNPQSIKSIKEYNKRAEANGGYLNNTLTDCEKSNNKFFNCSSSFITNIENGTENFGIDKFESKLDGVSKYTESLKNIK